jgi:hypothetical protein
MKQKPRFTRPGVRGAAMVEFAILMLVFVPLILLPMFFQDAIRFKMDMQEAVYSSVWDFAYGDYIDESISSLAGDIVGDNQDIFEDGWSGSDKESTGPWASFEWREEINCDDPDKSLGTNYYAMLAREYHSIFTNGGLAHCRGAIRVRNDYIPGLFLQENNNGFASQDNFSLKQGDEIDFDPLEFGLMVDSWSITKPDDAITAFGFPLSGLEFYERVDFVWTFLDTYTDMTDAWGEFADAMESADLSADKDTLESVIWGDNPGLLDLRSKHPADEQFWPVLLYKLKFYVTPYKDGDDDMYESTFEKREEGEGLYLGCTQFEPNCS